MIKIIFLGIIQGVTEFLPISSSGHLTIFQAFLGMENPEENLALDLILHAGTLVAVMWFFRDDLKPFFKLSEWKKKEQQHLAWLIVAGSFCTAVIGLSGKDFFESLFSKPQLVCGALFFTGVILMIAHQFSSTKDEKPWINFTTWRAILIGIAQGFAIIPGISRSGTTIAVGILCGLSGSQAARFSFLLMIPAVGGATLLEGRKWIKAGFAFDIPTNQLLAGGMTSLVFGILSLSMLMAIIRKQRLNLFAFYLFGASILFFLGLKNVTSQ